MLGKSIRVKKLNKMTLEQLQDKLLPILFDDNDKFEDVNRANILYNRMTDQITIKRTKFDINRCSTPDLKTWSSILTLGFKDSQVGYKCTKDKNSSRLVFYISKSSSVVRSLSTIEDILVKLHSLRTQIDKSFVDFELIDKKIISEETENALLRFQELLNVDIEKHTDIPS